MTGFWTRMWGVLRPVTEDTTNPMQQPNGDVPAPPLPPEVMRVTPDFIRRTFPQAHDPERWAAALRTAMARYDITTPRRMAYFMAQLGVESIGLTTLSENLNYRVAALWPRYENRGMTAAMAERMGRKPGAPPLIEEQQRAIANVIYGGEWGKRNLGNTGPNDGWNFRGAGAIQQTGRGNHQALADAFNLGAAENARPWLLTIPGAALGAAFFWNSRKLNSYADPGDFTEVCRRVQGSTSTVPERTAMLSKVGPQLGL